MRKILRNLVITTALLAIACAGALAADLPIQVSAVKGDVKYDRAGAEAPLAAEATLKAGDVIKTAADSEATIKWGGGNVVKVYPLSTFTIAEAGMSGDVETNSLNIENGKIFAKAKKLSNSKSKFEIRTPTAIAGVRGSEIFVTAAPDTSNFAVISGTFQVEADGLEVMLNQNFQIDVGTEPTQVETAVPVPISAEQMDELKIQADTAVEEAGPEEQTAAPAEPAETTTQETADEAVPDDVQETVQDTIDETITNDTITNQAIDTSLQELDSGMGGVNLTIE